MNDLRLQYQKYRKLIDANIEKVLASGQYIGGAFVQEFELALAAYMSSEAVISCGNGTDALQIALMALELPANSEVILPAFTFGAAAEAVTILGLKPIFADVRTDTFNIDPQQVRQLISEKTSCIIPVHMFGLCAEMNEIMDLANSYGLRVIEDTAQALGSELMYRGSWRKAGTMGAIGTFSFFPSKNLGCYGDGGATCSNDELLLKQMRMIKNHGTQKKYFHERLGMNSRLDALQAGILLAKLSGLDQDLQARIEHAANYNAELAGIEAICLPQVPSGYKHTWHQYTLKIKEKRAQVIEALNEAGIAHSIYYPVPLHRQAAFKIYGTDFECPVADELCEQVLSLPMYPELTYTQILAICQVIKNVF